MVFIDPGRFSVIVATGPATSYSTSAIGRSPSPPPAPAARPRLSRRAPGPSGFDGEGHVQIDPHRARLPEADVLRLAGVGPDGEVVPLDAVLPPRATGEGIAVAVGVDGHEAGLGTAVIVDVAGR